MKTPRTRIAKVIADRLQAGGDRQTLSREIAAFLVSEGRVSELNSLLRDVVVDRANAGYVEVVATVAHPLAAAAKAEIAQQAQKLYPKASQVVVTERHDPTVLGGVQVQIANDELDLSVEAKLNKLKQLTGSK